MLRGRCLRLSHRLGLIERLQDERNHVGAIEAVSRNLAIDSFDQVRKAGPLEFRQPKCARSQRPSNWQGASSTSARSHQWHHGASIWSLRSLPHRVKGAEESGRSSCVSIVTVGSLCKLGERQPSADGRGLSQRRRSCACFVGVRRNINTKLTNLVVGAERILEGLRKAGVPEE
jgi:hypothetical protein